MIRELLRRNPELPPERVDEVAIAATTQIGDQGLTIGRTAALLSGLPKTVPGYAIDRMCAGAMTAVTTTAAGIAFGAYDVVVAGGVEHMGHHPMGEGVDPNPRILADKLVDPSALVMGQTAENLHDRFPAITKQRCDAYAAASQEKFANAVRPARSAPSWSRATRIARARLGPGHRGRAAAARHDDGAARRAEDAVPPARPGYRGQRRRPQRRRDRRASWPTRSPPELGLPVADAPGRLLVRRRRA